MGATNEMNRSKSRNAAVALSSGDVLVIADADTMAPADQITAALAAVEEGADWVIAYERYVQLDGPDTRKVLALDPTCEVPPPARPRWETDQGNAGMLVVSRKAFETVGGYDERFVRWGWEDWAIADALETLCHPQVRVPGYVLHLCHPRDRDRSKRQGHPLSRRYTAAHGDPEAMTALIAEEGRRA
jgi:N-terminal domain of galactosyltransferase